jgi:repressor LexA
MRGRPPPDGEEGLMRGSDLTKRQLRILEVIREAVANHGYPPSIREIGESVGLTSTSSVHSQLAQLEKKGYIRRDPTKPRAILVRAPESGTAVARAPRKLMADIPLYSSQIAAGAPILADDQVEDVVPLPRDWVRHGELYMLKVKGDSMIEAGVLDGDYVVVRNQPDAENGEMVAALIDGEATVKHLSVKGDHAELLPANPAYSPIPLDPDGINIRILGKVVTVLRRFG